MRLRVPSIQTPTWIRDAANAINLLLGDIPEGGTSGQALVKASGDDYDMEWASVASGAHVHDATDVTFAPAGNIASTDVQAAIVELDTEKASTSHGHAIADVTGLQASLDAKLDDTQASAFGLTLIDDADAATARSTLGLGTAATQNTGTSGATIPFLNGTNTFGNSTQTLSAPASGNPLALKAGAADLVYISLFARNASPSTRSGWFGYGASATTLWTFNNEIGNIEFRPNNALRATLSSTGLDVVGLVQCDTFRIDATATAAAVAQTHHVPISINGVTYKLLLAS